MIRLEDSAAVDPVFADRESTEALIGLGILPTFPSPRGQLVLPGDLHELTALASTFSRQRSRLLYEAPLLKSGRLLGFPVSSNTWMDLSHSRLDPAAEAGLRGILRVLDHDRTERPDATLAYFGDARLRTRSVAALTLAGEQLARASVVANSKASVFANSAYYMGSKRALAVPIVEVLAQARPEIVLDLMCGSGAIAGAASRFWPTMASDAQQFCRLLARVQGKGFSVQLAQRILPSVMSRAREHAAVLSARLERFLATEDHLLHMEADENLVLTYEQFRRSLPLFGVHEPGPDWQPTSEVIQRQRNRGLAPYMLFTSYFALIYFGLRQCVEIDSIRFAIDQCLSGDARDFAIASLVAALSGIGTTYAGHFAQPPLRSKQLSNPRVLARVLEARARSVFHEFSVRFESLAEESERALFPVTTVSGPWRAALNSTQDLAAGKRVVVYLDAPYGRDEYSRYYHILETAVLYDYPAVTGAGRLPDKRSGERFASPFATRRTTSVEAELVDIVSAILRRGWACVWSYSDAGVASMPSIIEQVERTQRCSVRTIAFPHRYQGQGGRTQKMVTEYLIAFEPS